VRYRGPVERCFTVAFGPSRSKRFGKALAEAGRGAHECVEVEPGRYEARFVVGKDPAVYAALAAFLAHVRHWRATEVREGDEPVSAYHAKEMAWCASSQLRSFGACRFRFFYGVFLALATGVKNLHSALGMVSDVFNDGCRNFARRRSCAGGGPAQHLWQLPRRRPRETQAYHDVHRSAAPGSGACQVLVR